MLSALDLARRIEGGTLSPTEVIELCAKAIAERDLKIGAFVSIDIDRVRKLAEQPGLKDKPLCGLPVALKDIYDTADMPTEYGSPIYSGHRPRADGALVTMIGDAGGIVLGKTVTTEFAHTDPGKTRNPHNTDHTPGGSSSGSAAAVAAGFAPIATGSQTGGSIIRPASFCGVAGFKPSFGLLPTVGMKCVSWHLDTAGLFAATVADVAFATAIISKRDLRIDHRPPGSPRIGVLREQAWPGASADMASALDAAARKSSAAMGRVRDVKLPPVMATAFRAHSIIHGYEAARALGSEHARHKDKMGKGLRDLIEGARTITVDAYDNARHAASQARQAFADLMADFDVILSPSAPGAAPHSLKSTGSSTFNRLWTLIGVPCVNVPGLVDPGGLPLGVQVIGRFGADREALEAAQFVELALRRN